MKKLLFNLPISQMFHRTVDISVHFRLEMVFLISCSFGFQCLCMLILDPTREPVACSYSLKHFKCRALDVYPCMSPLDVVSDLREISKLKGDIFTQRLGPENPENQFQYSGLDLALG